MKNRYNKILRDNNQEILDLVAYKMLYTITALEIKKVYKKQMSILEIGCGEGDSAKPLLEQTEVSVDLLDASSEMLRLCKKKLKKYKDRTTFIHKDALKYLSEANSYNIIYAAWTIHNFIQEDKEALFKSIYKTLKPGGLFILADKVYVNSNWKKALSLQNERYKRYLKPSVAKAIIQHEKEDASDACRIEEKPLIKKLKSIGFRDVELIDRIERDVVIIAKK